MPSFAQTLPHAGAALAAWAAFAAVFLALNARIVFTDVREKRIPNRLVAAVAGAGAGMAAAHGWDAGWGAEAWAAWAAWAAGALPLGFLAWKAGIWSAGDAKYAAALAVAAPGGLLTLGGNVALLAAAWVGLSTSAALAAECAKPGGARRLAAQVRADVADRLRIWANSGGGRGGAARVARAAALLLGVGLAFRIFARVGTEWAQGAENGWGEFFRDKPALSFLGVLAAGYGAVLVAQWGLRTARKWIVAYWPSTERGLGAWAALALLAAACGLEAYLHGAEALRHIALAAGAFPAVIVAWKTAKYVVVLASQLDSVENAPWERLKAGDIVDKPSLMAALGTQKCLGYRWDDGPWGDSPAAMIRRLPNPLDEESAQAVREAVAKVNAYHGRPAVTTVKLLRPFAFAPYLLAGFFITFAFGESPLRAVAEFVLGK